MLGKGFTIWVPVNRPRKWMAFASTLKPKQPLALRYSRDFIWVHFRFLGGLFLAQLSNSPTLTTILSCYSSHSSLLPLKLVTFAPQHRDFRCKNGLFHNRPPSPFLVTSPRPRPRPRPLPFPPPKATTFTSVAASFASNTYN
jgi:hypothetical protein